MPVKPTASESEDQFIGRCMSEEKDSFPDVPQRYAVCKSKWDTANMSKIKDTTSKVMAKIAYENKFEGINLAAPLEKGPNDPCYEDYVQIGTKDLDGREVPNCVPLSSEADKVQMEKKYNFAEGDGKYPWSECIADQTARYGNEETAKKVCGYIKSQSGS
jgi:hypothetical protein